MRIGPDDPDEDFSSNFDPDSPFLGPEDVDLDELFELEDLFDLEEELDFEPDDGVMYDYDSEGVEDGPPEPQS